jgi:glutamate/tyrosine decarboxylase-like PLP-dependent enzyme
MVPIVDCIERRAIYFSRWYGRFKIMSHGDTRQLLADASGRAAAYLEGLGDRCVRPERGAVDALAASLSGGLPERGVDAANVIADLDALGSPATVATAGRRYFGFVTGGALPVTVAASALAAAWDQNAFSRASSESGAVFDEAALRWLAELLGLPAACAGALVTGATMANLTALAAARRALLAKQGWDAEADGLFGAPPFDVYLGEEAHASARKALALLGLGKARVRTLPVDAQGRIRADRLPRLEVPALVLTQAGNVNSGASDPFPALRDWCDAAGAWLHVDGAFGLFAAASPLLREQVRGVERADSWAADAHKWLNVPYDSGIVYVRDAAALRGAMASDAAYLPASFTPEGGDLREPFHYGPELSRRARGVEIVAALRHLGRAGVAELVERCCALARRFAESLRSAGYEVLNDVVLNQVVVAFGDDAATARTIARVQEEGVCWAGPTHWRGRGAMRISVSSWATREADVDASLASILRCAAQIRL